MKLFSGFAAVAIAAAAPYAAAQVVISQVYGGNGNTYANDYVELVNAGAAPVNVTGWSIQYASSTGTGHFAANGITVLPSMSLQPGQYLLARMASAGTGAALPGHDASGTTNLSSTAGKVALINNSTGLACNGGSTPCDAGQLAQIVDLVGYGGANFFETAPAPLLTATTAGLRAQDGCTDTNNNASDFTAGTPNPRNSASTFAACSITPTTTAIYLIQGNGTTSPMVGQSVTTEGVVTRVNNNGYFMQDVAGDDDPLTSDGIFVFTGAAPTVSVGQLIRVTGTVAEFNTGSPSNADTAAHPVTELTGTSGLTVLSSGHTITPTSVTLPEVQNDDLERYEGMLVTIAGPLTASQNYFLGRYGQITLAAGARLQNPTNAKRPGAQANKLAAQNAKRRILLDDGTSQQNPNPTPYIGEGNTQRAGDQLASLTGVVDYGLATSSNADFGDYKIHPTVAPVFTRVNERKAKPAKLDGNLKVASFNTLNYFTTFTDGTTADGQSGQGCSVGGAVSASNCRGASNLAEFNRQRTKAIEAIAAMKADVVGLMEMQNNGTVAVQNLVDGLNAKLGAGTYAIVPDPASGTGTDAIKVAMIFKPLRVSLSGASTSDTDPIHNRPPLAQTFQYTNGAKLTVIANHFKSKSCDGATGLDQDQGDLQGCYNARRVQQADALRAFSTARQTASGNTDVALVGDFNAYAKEDPIHTLTSNGYVDEIARTAGNKLAYSYVFNGEAGRLDHLLTTPSLSAKVNGAIEWHINADEPSVLDYNLEFKQPACGTCAPDLYTPTMYRSSDHDPAIMGITLTAPAERRAMPNGARRLH